MPKKTDRLGLPIGKHISVRATIDGKEVTRSYTPISSDDDLGYFELMIKTYPNGNISKYMDGMKLGDLLEVRGPKGNFNYSPNMCSEIGMIAGGTGLTPLLQVIKASLTNPADTTKISLIYANVTEDDILLKEQLDELSKKHSERFKVFYVLNTPPVGWKGGIGYVTGDIITANCPAPHSSMKILLCGPPPMIKAMEDITLKLGYTKTNVVSKPEDMIFKF